MSRVTIILFKCSWVLLRGSPAASRDIFVFAVLCVSFPLHSKHRTFLRAGENARSGPHPAGSASLGPGLCTAKEQRSQCDLLNTPELGDYPDTFFSKQGKQGGESYNKKGNVMFRVLSLMSEEPA